MPKKPRGSPSYYRVRIDPAGAPHEFVQAGLELPEDKASIERVIATAFARDAEQYELPFQFLSEPHQNDENDIDFSVETSLGTMGLELVEYAPIATDGFPSQQPAEFDPATRVAQIMDLIGRKEQKYRTYNLFQHLMLVVYVTHDVWSLDYNVLRGVQYLAYRSAPVFGFVAYYKPMRDISGPVFLLRPIDASEHQRIEEEFPNTSNAKPRARRIL